MNKRAIVSLSLFVFIFISGCTFSKYPYPNHLPPKGEYSIIVVYPRDYEMEKPAFLIGNEEDAVSKEIEVFQAIENIYPLLNIETAAYLFIFRS